MEANAKKIKVPIRIQPAEAEHFAGNGLSSKLSIFSFGFEPKGGLFVRLPGIDLYYILTSKQVYRLATSEVKIELFFTLLQLHPSHQVAFDLHQHQILRIQC